MQGQLGEQVLNGCNTELAVLRRSHCRARNGCSPASTPTATSSPSNATMRSITRVPAERAIGAITYVASECRAELETHCADVDVGEGRVAQCLKEHAGELSPGCGQALTEAGVK